MADSALRLYAENHPALAGTLRVRLEARRSELIKQNGEGYSQDWSDYKHRAGVIQGLQDAIDICEQAEKDLEKR